MGEIEWDLTTGKNSDFISIFKTFSWSEKLLGKCQDFFKN